MAFRNAAMPRSIIEAEEVVSMERLFKGYFRISGHIPIPAAKLYLNIYRYYKV